MGSVAGEQNAALAEPVRDQGTCRPADHLDDLDVDLGAHHLVDQRVRVHLIGGLRHREACVAEPVVAAVEREHSSEAEISVVDRIRPRGPGVHPLEVTRPEMHRHGLAQLGDPFERRADRLPHHAVCSVAANEV